MDKLKEENETLKEENMTYRNALEKLKEKIKQQQILITDWENKSKSEINQLKDDLEHIKNNAIEQILKEQ